MSKRFCVLIEDDWEVAGNGLGNVASHQYIPSLFFMKLAMRLGIKLTFMVDVAQQLIYQKNQDKDPNIKLQKRLWDDSVQLMKQYGFDVQLHLHPQWYNAELKNDLFYLSNNWNIGTYKKEIQKQLITESVDYLEKLLKQIDPGYKVIAFKGGSWGLQPSNDLLKNMADNGIKIITGVRKGMKIPQNGVDYSTLEEEIMPYYPDFADINKISAKEEELVVVPLQEYSPNIFALSSIGSDLIRKKISRNDAIKHFYTDEIPGAIKNLLPVKKLTKLKFGLNPYKTHLKIGDQPFRYLKASFDTVIKRLEKTNHPRIPILIECHTKLYRHYYSDVEKFLQYIKEEYGNEVEFSDMTSFYNDIKNHNQLVRKKNA